MKMSWLNCRLSSVLCFGLVVPLMVSEDAKTADSESNTKSPSQTLMLSVETPLTKDLKALSEILVEPQELDSWKQQGVVSRLVPSLFGRSNRKLPKYFVLNLFNPFAGKQYGHIDPLKPYSGPRPGRRGAHDVKTADMAGVPLFGSQW